MKKPHFIITGFEPFLQHERNPSAEVAHHTAALLQQRYDQKAEHHTLPVTYDIARDFTTKLGASSDHILVHIGLAASRTHISLERRAHNACGTTPDNDQKLPGDLWGAPHGGLQQDGPQTSDTQLDLELLKQELEDYPHITLHEVRITHDAGTYVCNAIYYHSLQHNKNSVFIHIPPMEPKQCMELSQALAHALHTLTLSQLPQSDHQ